MLVFLHLSFHKSPFFVLPSAKLTSLFSFNPRISHAGAIVTIFIERVSFILSACIAALSKDRFNGNDDDNDIEGKTLLVFLFFSYRLATREKKRSRSCLEEKRQRKNREGVSAMREVLVSHCIMLTPSNPVKHTDEIERPRASVTHDLDAI